MPAMSRLHCLLLLTTLAVSVACGGAEEAHPPAPLPDSWIRQDEGRASVRPEPSVLQPAGSVHGDGATTGGSNEATAGSTTRRGSGANERRAFSALSEDFTRVWNTRSAIARARAGCAAPDRWANLAGNWLSAAADAAPNRSSAIDHASGPLLTALMDLADWCGADIDADGISGVEGRIQSVGQAIDELDETIRGYLE
jgi:hypothetical protein